MLTTLDVSSLSNEQKRTLINIITNIFLLTPTDSLSTYSIQAKEKSKNVNACSRSFVQENSSECNKSMYEEILKPFTPKVRPATKSPERYQDFLQNFRNLHGVRAKRLDKHSLITIIEGIYSARFAEEQNTFKKAVTKTNQDGGEPSFSKFVSKYIENKWKSLRLSSQVLSY